jgi:tRNA A37 threonylcarbamoyladenosine synthetase subunit TsaC/SUA5/YrdC
MNWPPNEVIYVLQDDDAIAYNAASTLVRLSGSSIEILRAGPVAESEIRRVIAG